MTEADLKSDGVLNDGGVELAEKARKREAVDAEKAGRNSELLLPVSIFLCLVSAGGMIGFRAVFPDNINVLTL